MKTIRIAVIGVGTIAKMAHIANYAVHPEVEIVGFVDTELERVQKVAQEFALAHDCPMPLVCKTLTELLAQTAVDAVSICTPNGAHAALALEALAAGQHVLLEKPMCVTVDEAKAIERAAADAGTVVMVGMSHRYRDDVEVLRRVIASGELGEMYYVKTRILRRRGTPGGWFTDLAQSGGGPLMDIGVHALDLAWWLVGQPRVKSVSGFMRKAIGRDALDFVSRWTSSSPYNAENEIYTTEDFASAFVRFENGLVMQLEVSWALNGPEDDALKLEVFGSQGGVSLDPLKFYHTAHGVLAEQSHSVRMGDLYGNEIAHFIDCIQTGKRPVSDVSQGADVVRMLALIARSAETGCEVQEGKE